MPSSAHYGMQREKGNGGFGFLPLRPSTQGSAADLGDETLYSGAIHAEADLEISGGTVYIYCNGDGIDSNSRATYGGIAFSGGKTVVISNSNGNSAIDSEQGYSYTGGTVIAVMPRGGMSEEATRCKNFSSIGKSAQISLTAEHYLVVETKTTSATIRMPVSLNALVLVLGDKGADVKTASSTHLTPDQNGVIWGEGL